MLDPLALDTLRSKATALKNELESASRVKTSPGTIRRIEVSRKDTWEGQGSGSGNGRGKESGMEIEIEVVVKIKDTGNGNENGWYFF